MGQTIVIVIPCYNESKRLQPAKFSDFVCNFNVRYLFVDDGSQDDTISVLAGMQESIPGCLPPLKLDQNVGKAEAVRRGILQGLSYEPAAIGFWDADLATPLSEISVFAEAMFSNPKLDIIMGSRVQMLGRDIQRDPLRHYVGRVAATVVSRMLRLPVYDTQCGAKLFRNDDKLEGLFGKPFRTRWLFDVEILARWLGRFPGRQPDNGRILEIPVHKWTDVSDSRLTGKDFLRVPLDLFRIYREYDLGRRS